MDRETFRREVELALANLRDVVQLRSMDLAATLLPDLPRSDRGWGISRLLLDAVDRLRPDQGDQDDWPRRRYEVLTLRYVNGLSPDEAADRLACSRRHFYRQLVRALDEFADFLWAERPDQVGNAWSGDGTPSTTAGRDSSHLALLRREAAPLQASQQSCSLAEVWQSVLEVLSPLLVAQSVVLHVDLPAALPEVLLSPQILKQFLLALLGDLLSEGVGGGLSLAAQVSDDGQTITTTVRSLEPRGLHGKEGACDGGAVRETIGRRASTQLAVMHGVRLAVAGSEGVIYRVELPAASAQTVLVVEDNEEVCLLFQRYLSSGGYRSLVATSGGEAMALARAHDLYAVTLDLMMSDEDGWDVLQSLRHDPQTSHLPILVCTVLDHRDLALMLGASAFLKKPVMREQLLQTLAGFTRP